MENACLNVHTPMMGITVAKKPNGAIQANVHTALPWTISAGGRWLLDSAMVTSGGSHNCNGSGKESVMGEADLYTRRRAAERRRTAKN